MNQKREIALLRYVYIGLCLVFATACSGGTCTLLGCFSGLVVKFSTPPTAPYHIEATSPDAGPRSYDCKNNSGCVGDIIEDYLPQTVTLTITYQGRTTTTTVRPSYQDTYPNGEDCGSGCRKATVTLPLP